MKTTLVATALSLGTLVPNAYATGELPPGTLHVKAAEIIDRSGFGRAVTAATLLVPADWSFEGEVSWNPQSQCVRGPLWSWNARSPDGRSSITRLPGLATGASNSPFAPPVCPPGITPNAQALLEHIVAGTMPGVRIASVEREPEIAEALATMTLTIPESSGTIRLSYDHVVGTLGFEENGTPMRGLVLLVSSHFGSQSHIVGAGTLEQVGAHTELFVGLSAPLEEFDARVPDFLLALSSTRIEPDYQKLLAEVWRQRLGEADRKGRAMHEATMSAIAAIGQSGTAAFEARDAASDERQKAFVQMMRETTTVQTSQGPREVPHGPTWWEKPDGSLIGSTSPEFYPEAAGIDAKRLQ